LQRYIRNIWTVGAYFDENGGSRKLRVKLRNTDVSSSCSLWVTCLGMLEIMFSGEAWLESFYTSRK